MLLPAVAGDATLELSTAPLCRWFRPSPCPTHYRGRLATMPSADFCPRTSYVAALRAVCRLRVRWGYPRAFALALSPAPIASHRSLNRSPQIRTGTVTTQPPDLPCSANSWSLLSCASSTLRLGLVSDFCSSARRFALRLPSDRPSRDCLCLRLVVMIVNMVNAEFSDRGLSPHKFMPVLGVHPALNRTPRLRRSAG